MPPQLRPNTTLAWDAPEYHYIERTTDWYWLLGIVSVCIAVLCILFGNILFAIFILLAAFSAGMYAAREAKLAHFELQPKGIMAHNLFYEYSTLDSFWIDETHPLPRIILKSKKLLMTHIIVPVADLPTDEIRHELLQHLPEEEHQESIFHRLFERLGL